MRPQHYRVYSKVDEGMWCCVGSGIESHARHGEFIYAHDDDALYVNLFIASQVDWRERGVKVTQSTRFPDESRTRLTVDGAARFALKIRYPGWVAPGALKVRLNGKPVKVVAKPDSNWDATTSRNVTTTMLQQNPDICSIIDFWDGDATGASAAIRDAKLDGKVFLVTTGGGEKAADCDKLVDGTYGAVVMTDLARQSGDMNAIIKFLLQSGQPAGTSHTYIYTLEKATTKADLKPDSCWDLKALQAEAAAK